MSKSTAIEPVQPVARPALLKRMSPAAKEFCTYYDQKIAHVAKGLVLSYYDIGSRVKELLADEDKCGKRDISDIADYLDLPGRISYLFELRDFAVAFPEKSFVTEWAAQPMASGGYLTLRHWIELAKIESTGDRQKMLQQTLKNSWSTRQLDAEISAGAVAQRSFRQGGGRQPNKPTSALSGLQQLCSATTRINRLEDNLNKHVFDAIESLAADRVNEALRKKLVETRTLIKENRKADDRMLERIADNIERVDRILEQSEADAKAAGEDEPGEKAAPAKADKASKPERNGAVHKPHTARRSGKPHKARRQRAAAGAR